MNAKPNTLAGVPSYEDDFWHSLEWDDIQEEQLLANHAASLKREWQQVEQMEDFLAQANLLTKADFLAFTQGLRQAA
ncbi:hypothetical protein PshuTeo2_52720 (plasmid) [Pseudomonas hunanensis]|uniref:hypothetical protein n=1 Tax=Pseudomonas hunanensis TaxID=1247546 RepID=UPI002AA0DEBC|nr:hypothetical protein [Pseudomonas hunanensis]MDY7075074.1 hypothetical protein [Pseudomonas hunanensis]